MSHESEKFGRRSFLSFHAALAAASAYALVLLAAPSYAQTVTQKQTTMTQLNPVPYAATPAVRFPRRRPPRRSRRSSRSTS